MNVIKFLGTAAVALLLLAACGGGSSNQSIGPGPSGNLVISAERDSVEANPREVLPDPDSPHTVQITVRFTNPGGGFVADGTSVNLTSNSSALGLVSPIDNPTNTASTVSSPTAAGSARFWFTAGTQTGTVSLDASATDPSSGRTITASLQLSVVPFSGDPSRVVVEVNQTNLPANAFEFAPLPGSPFSTQVNVTALGSDGEPVADGTDVSLGVDDVGRAQVSPVGNPATLGATAVNQTVGGIARFLLTSNNQTGPVTLIGSFIDQDPNTGEQATFVSPPVVVTIEPFDPDIERITVSAIEESLPANILDIEPSINSQFSTQVNVDVLTDTGSVVPDGTQVSLGVNNLALAGVAPLDSPSTTAATATAATVGGTARFLVTSGRDAGTVALVATDVSANVVGEPFELAILPNDSDETRLRISGSSTVPANTQGVPIFLGSPFINELTVEYIGPDGQPGDVADSEIAVAIAPVNVGAYSTLDDPETDEINEFLVLVGSGPVNMAAGVTTLFVHSFDQPGTVTVTVVAVDANSGERFSAKFDVEVIDGGADFLPSQFDFSVSPEPVYVQGSGGATNKPMQLIVNDSGGNPVPNPEVDGNVWNNVRLELDAPAGSGARLVGTGSEGPVNGTDIAVQSVNGIVNFTMNAGTETGPHRVIATADRADNNVDNDIIDPLQAEMTVEVGDGQLFSLTLISPILNAISVNPTTSGVSTSFSANLDPLSGALIPTDPDGTYSLTITAQGTDKVGNPVLPGTRVDFGKIDDPLTPGQPRFFVFSGPDGDPQEGGTLFSVFDPVEDFLDDSLAVDEAVEPGDTVALFGKAVPGNREHEAVRIVQSVIDDNTVVVTEPFNPNDPTGAIVDDGFAIPWVIGRSQIGTIDQTVELDADGRGSVQLTYPLSQLGRRAVLWTQGTRVEQPSNKTVADVASSVFPGVEPLLLTAQPSVIQANDDSIVRLCLTDALGSPIQGVFINGGITDGPATGALDGVPMTTSTANATGTDGAGCVNTVVTTSGLVPEGDPATITFFFDEAQAQVQVVPPGAASLEVLPSRVSDPTLAFYEVSLLLTLRDGMGDPISGVDLTGECEADEGTLEISGQPGVTDADGEAIATVLIGLTACGDGTGEGFPRLAQCTFTTPSGVPIGLFTAVGSDARLFTQSPGLSCPPLEDPPETGEFEMIVEDNRSPAGDSLVQSIPTGIACDAAASASDNAVNCSAIFNVGTTVILRAPTGTAPTWAGACEVQTDPRFASVTITGDDAQQACLAEFNDPPP